MHIMSPFFTLYHILSCCLVSRNIRLFAPAYCVVSPYLVFIFTIILLLFTIALPYIISYCIVSLSAPWRGRRWRAVYCIFSLFSLFIYIYYHMTIYHCPHHGEAADGARVEPLDRRRRLHLRPYLSPSLCSLSLSHTHTLTHAHIHTQLSPSIPAAVSTCIPLTLHTHTHTHTHAHAHARTHKHTHAHAPRESLSTSRAFAPAGYHLPSPSPPV